MRVFIKLFSIFSLCLIMMLFGCDILMSNKNMLNYYSDDSNYETITCIIVSKRLSNYPNSIVVDIQAENSSFTPDYYGYNLFHFYFDTEIYDLLNVDDVVIITSAPMIFYNGQIPPIVYLEKDGETLISYEEGKAAYLDWIENEW